MAVLYTVATIVKVQNCSGTSLLLIILNAIMINVKLILPVIKSALLEDRCITDWALEIVLQFKLLSMDT